MSDKVRYILPNTGQDSIIRISLLYMPEQMRHIWNMLR